MAIRTAVAERGVSVLVLPGDVALTQIGNEVRASASLLPRTPVVHPSDVGITELSLMLNAATRVTLLCGRGCYGAHEQVMRLAEKLERADRACVGRQRGDRIRQPIRCGDDGVDRLQLGLRGDGCVRHAADAGHGLSVPAVLSGEGEDRAGGFARVEIWGGAASSTSGWWAMSSATIEALLPR